MRSACAPSNAPKRCCPGFPATQTLAVMVLIARQSLEFAVAAAARGAAAQAAQYDRTPYPASGLLWLRGLTAAASGDHIAALDHFLAEETSSRGASTVYARECLVLALEARGFTHLALGDRDAAGPAFHAAAAASPGHGRATLGLAIAAGEATDGVDRVAGACADMARVGKHGECALLLAAAHGWGGRADEGLAVAEQALVTTSPDATGWSLPADPLFAPLRAAGGYGAAGRASRLPGVLSRRDVGHRFSPLREGLRSARHVGLRASEASMTRRPFVAVAFSR